MEHKKKKIGFVIGKLSSGGAERVISTLSNELIESFDIVIITFVKSTPFYDLDKRIKVIACRDFIDYPSSIFQSLKLNYLLIKRISRIIKREHIHIAIGFITSANILATIAAKINHIPCIISERNNPLLEDVPRFWMILRRFIYPLADSVILQTQGVKKIYEKKIKPHKIIILPNPISTELSKMRKNKPRKKIILTVGRLHKSKCQDIIIKAFSSIDANDWEVIIIGDGNKKQELNTLIEENDLSSKIKIISKVARIDEYYNEASIFVFTSKTEGFPNVLLEAMHFGLPCISTDCNFGPSDLIKDGINGFLISIDDQKLLESRLVELINDSKLREEFSKKSKLTTENYKSEKVIAQWEKLINTFL